MQLACHRINLNPEEGQTCDGAFTLVCRYRNTQAVTFTVEGCYLLTACGLDGWGNYDVIIQVVTDAGDPGLLQVPVKGIDNRVKNLRD